MIQLFLRFKNFIGCFFFIQFLFALELKAGDYGEHKFIGDSAMKLVMRFANNSSLNQDAKFFLQTNKKLTNHFDSVFSFGTLYDKNDKIKQITYGDLNAIAGDHSTDPFQMFSQLYGDEYSLLKRILLFQEEHLKQYYLSAPDFDMFKMDNSYLWTSIEDESHFYRFGKSFEKHLRIEDFDMCYTYWYNGNIDRLFNYLSKTNSIFKYTFLHSLACFYASKFQEVQNNKIFYFTKDSNNSEVLVDSVTTYPGLNSKLVLLKVALTINAFADHYLQDAFASGHRSVNRSQVFFFNDKLIHDKFNKVGLTAVNLYGIGWNSFGDGRYNKDKIMGSEGIKYLKFNVNSQFYTHSKQNRYAILAVAQSIWDILHWTANDKILYQNIKPKYYDSSFQNYPIYKFDVDSLNAMNELYDKNILNTKFVSDLICDFPSLGLIPIPYNTRLTTINSIRDSMFSEYKLELNNLMPEFESIDWDAPFWNFKDTLVSDYLSYLLSITSISNYTDNNGIKLLMNNSLNMSEFENNYGLGLTLKYAGLFYSSTDNISESIFYITEYLNKTKFSLHLDWNIASFRYDKFSRINSRLYNCRSNVLFLGTGLNINTGFNSIWSPQLKWTLLYGYVWGIDNSLLGNYYNKTKSNTFYTSFEIGLPYLNFISLGLRIYEPFEKSLYSNGSYIINIDFTNLIQFYKRY